MTALVVSLRYWKNLMNMSKLFSIGFNRSVSVKKQDGVLNVTISELGSEVKSLTFPAYP